MLFNSLQASTSLELVQYSDIDHFRESERYAGAESMPLQAGDFAVLRANVALPSGSLSLVRTFPRLIKGYDFSGRLVIVVPMDDVISTRVNGKNAGRSLIILKGSTNCTVYEPQGRLVAILSIRAHTPADSWFIFDEGHVLLRLTDAALAHLQNHIRGLFETAAKHPHVMRTDASPDAIEAALLAAFDDAMCGWPIDQTEVPSRYKNIVDHIERLLASHQTKSVYCEMLAKEIGISVRTMNSAVHAVCGTSPLRYSQLMRLWAVRRQLRNGAPGLTVRASAFAHGFSHMGDFSRLYRDTIGELPSQTLANARLTA